MIRRSSTAKAPASGLSIARQSSPQNAEQTRVAEAYIAQLNQAHVFNAAIVIRIEPGRDFYRAEDYHQDFLTPNPTYPYIVVNDLPKIENLKRVFSDLYRATPALVGAVAPRS
jgi:peptide-methionine (S)-S-oxide reductase